MSLTVTSTSRPADPTLRLRLRLRLLRRRMVPGASLTRRVALTVATLAGVALLATSGIVHLHLWSDGYREIAIIGPLFVAQGIVAILLAIGVARFPNLGNTLAGAFVLLASAVALIISNRVGLFGLQEDLQGPAAQVALNAGIAGFAILIAAAWLILTSSPRSASARTQSMTAADEPAGAQVGDRLKWPAERPAVSVPAPAKSLPWATKAQAAGSDQEAPPSTTEAPQPAPSILRWPPERTTVAEPVPAVAANQIPEAVDPLAEPASEQTPAVDQTDTGTVDRDPSVEVKPAPEPVLLQPSLVAEQAPEPVRSLLVREEQILVKLEQAKGPDHPSTLRSRTNLAYYYLAAGQASQATVLQEQVLTDSNRILGKNHPHTVTARRKLQDWRRLAKKRGNKSLAKAG
ncbi:MAG: tetratricopeptide repeat protein [Actinomycetota bacterium]